MSTQKSRIVLTVVVLIIFAAFIGGLFVAQHSHVKKEIDVSKFHGTVLKQARKIEPFRLTGIDDKPFTEASLQGQWTILFFGFTNCGHVCPTTMAELNKMYRILEEKNSRPLPKIVMISIDPERDSLDKLAHYVKAFNPDFYGARGDKDTIQQMAQEMGVAYAKVEQADADNKEVSNNYDVQHSAALMLFNPQGELAAFFTTPHRADLLAEDYQLLIA